MTFLTYALVVLHILGAAAIIGPALEQLRSKTRRITTVMLWGARAQLLTGIALVGVTSANDDAPNSFAAAVKLVVAIAVVGIGEATRKKGAVAWAYWAVLILSVINVIVAVFWI